jgi:hypothetical protein
MPSIDTYIKGFCCQDVYWACCESPHPTSTIILLARMVWAKIDLKMTVPAFCTTTEVRGINITIHRPLTHSHKPMARMGTKCFFMCNASSFHAFFSLGYCYMQRDSMDTGMHYFVSGQLQLLSNMYEQLAFVHPTITMRMLPTCRIPLPQHNTFLYHLF